MIEEPLIEHHMGRRCNGWDYAGRAIYMVTVSLAARGRPVLAGWPEERQTAPEVAPEAENGAGGARYFCPLTPLGEIVLECWREIPGQWPMISLIDAVVMPDHFHGLLFVKSPLPEGKALGNVIGSFKSRSTSRILGRTRPSAEQSEYASAGRARRQVAGSAAGRVRPQVAGSAAGRVRPAFWAEGFVDTILFRERQLAAMAAYIRDNPARLAEKRANPGLFHRVANLSLPLDCGRLCGHFEALGNSHLLKRPLHQVQCSRRFFAWRRVFKPGGGLKIARDAAGEPLVEHTSRDYAERLAAALDAAAHGAVVLSPCISDGERQIAREVMERRLPLVALNNKGFAPLQKPAGRYFDACASGRLLLLAPAAWPYSTQEKTMTRDDATALNRICQWLAGEDAAAIDYHGTTPADIDRLAIRATLAERVRPQVAGSAAGRVRPSAEQSEYASAGRVRPQVAGSAAGRVRPSAEQSEYASAGRVRPQVAGSAAGRVRPATTQG